MCVAPLIFKECKAYYSARLLANVINFLKVVVACCCVHMDHLPLSPTRKAVWGVDEGGNRYQDINLITRSTAPPPSPSRDAGPLCTRVSTAPFRSWSPFDPRNLTSTWSAVGHCAAVSRKIAQKNATSARRKQYVSCTRDRGSAKNSEARVKNQMEAQKVSYKTRPPVCRVEINFSPAINISHETGRRMVAWLPASACERAAPLTLPKPG